MRSVDLTHPLGPNASCFPGDPAPKLEPLHTLEQDGFRQTLLTLGSHAGTHADAPRHLLPEGASLDSLPLTRFCGTAAVLHCPPGIQTIGSDLLAPVREIADRADFLLLDTGWSRKWRTEDYLSGWPVPDEALIEYLVSSGKKGVGIDALSIDSAESEVLPNHRALLEAGLVIFENLCSLSRLPAGPFSFCALPLLFENSDGAPVRAAAFLEESPC